MPCTYTYNTIFIVFFSIGFELERLKEENSLQHDQIVALTKRLMETEIRLHQLTTENEEQCSLLTVTKETQNILANELIEFKTKYQEVVSLLNETQEQLRLSRKRTFPTSRLGGVGANSSNTSVLGNDCLQYELDTVISDSSLDSGISMISNNPAYKNVFDTIKAVQRTNTIDDNTPHLGAMAMSSATQPLMSAFAGNLGGTSSISSYSYRGTNSVYSNYPSFDSGALNKTMSKESLVSDGDEFYPPRAPTGTPGCPGAKDLEAALKRLTPAEVIARRAALAHGPSANSLYDDSQSFLPVGCRTPDSIMSTGLSCISGVSSQPWRLPDKLQIIKPMEGSQTLGHWSKLATPTLGGLLEDRPGVKTRGGRGLDNFGLNMYSLSDVEEDFDDHPGKQFQESGCVYTYTNSTVMHPDDGTLAFSLPQSQIASQMSSQMSSQISSRQTTCPPTPRMHSRRNSCSTFSVSVCLASMLNERGIKAVTQSTLNTPCGQNFSPTVTPCNSPEISPPRSLSPDSKCIKNLISSGANILRGNVESEQEMLNYRQSRNKITLSRLERRALKSIRILEKVENIGIDNNMQPAANTTAVSPLSISASHKFYNTHSRSASPMAQLTSLKKLSSFESSNAYKIEDVRINRDAIRAILNKGLSSDNIKGLSMDNNGNSGSSHSGSISDKSSPTTSTPDLNNSKHNEAKDVRVKQMQRQKSRRNLTNARQRTDLGRTNVRPDLGTVSKKPSHISQAKDDKPQSIGFVGTISSLLFGRKGGLL